MAFRFLQLKFKRSLIKALNTKIIIHAQPGFDAFGLKNI